MTAIDRFAWRMQNVEGVQDVITLPFIAKTAIAGWNEGSLKWRNIPREQAQLTQSTRYIETSTGPAECRLQRRAGDAVPSCRGRHRCGDDVVNPRPRVRHEPTEVALELPTAPEPPPRRPLPWVALPVPVAAVMAVFFGPMMLAFALMGPVLVVGTHLSDRVGSRRRYAEELADLRPPP